MGKYETRQELANKIDYEGGLDGFLHYGFDPTDDVPEGDAELENLATTMIARWNDYQEAAGYFEALLPEPRDEEF